MALNCVAQPLMEPVDLTGPIDRQVSAAAEFVTLFAAPFFSGRPCSTCGSTERYTKTKACVTCRRLANKKCYSKPEYAKRRKEYSKKYSAEYNKRVDVRQRINAQRRIEYQQDSIARKKVLQKAAEYRAKPLVKTRMKEYYNRNYLRKTYGMDHAKYVSLLEAQSGKCPICDDALVRPHVDHNHITGEVMGLLCYRCNHGLGNYRDMPALLRKAARYLEEMG